MQLNPKRRRPIRLIASICLLVVIDQVVKAIVRTTLAPGEGVTLLDDVLRVTFDPNFSGFSWWVPTLPAWTKPVYLALRIFILLAAFPVYLFYTRTRRQSIWAHVAFVGILAGTWGNLMEDFFLPYTTDFIQVFHLPSANFADIYGYVGIGALMVEIVLMLRIRKPRWRAFRQHLADEVHIWKAFYEFLRRGLKVSK